MVCQVNLNVGVGTSPVCATVITRGHCPAKFGVSLMLDGSTAGRIVLSAQILDERFVVYAICGITADTDRRLQKVV